MAIKTKNSSVKAVRNKKPVVAASIQEPQIINDTPLVEKNQFSVMENIPTTEETTETTKQQSSEDFAPISLWSAIKNSPHFLNMLIGLASSFLVSASFYWAGKNMMKIKFEDMFEEKLPRYKNLVYSIGSAQNIDVDRVLLRDDLHDQHFTTDESSNSITVDINKIIEQYQQKAQSSAVDQQDIIVPKKVLKDKLKSISPQITTEQEDIYTLSNQAAVTVNASSYLEQIPPVSVLREQISEE